MDAETSGWGPQPWAHRAASCAVERRAALWSVPTGREPRSARVSARGSDHSYRRGVWRVGLWPWIGLVTLGCAVPTKIGELEGTDTVTDGDSEASTTDTVESTTDASTTTEEGTGSSGAEDSDTDTVGPGPQMSFAILFGDLPDDPGTGSGGSSTTSGGGMPDDTLLVEITTGPASCADVSAPLPCGGAWNISFSLPADLQIPGTYDLVDLNGLQFINLDADATGECGGGGGSLEGTVIIDSIDDTQVVGRIENADPFDFDPNVSFVAPRC